MPRMPNMLRLQRGENKTLYRDWSWPGPYDDASMSLVGPCIYGLPARLALQRLAFLESHANIALPETTMREVDTTMSQT